MKKTIRFLFIALLLLNTSCSKSNGDDPISESESVGYLSTGFRTQIDSSYTETKAPRADVLFWIRIKNRATDSYVYQSAMDRIADILELKVGSYNVEADFPEVKEDAAFNQPHFWGVMNEVDIEKDKITRLNEITTSIQNMKVDVEFGAHIKEHFSEYSLTVSNDKGELTFNQFTAESGYYTLSVLKAKFAGRRMENNGLFEKDFGIIVTTIGKAFHHKIVIDSRFSTVKGGNTGGENRAKNEFIHPLYID